MIRSFLEDRCNKFRTSLQERQQATERQLQELSERVAALELERDQLQRALETATNDSQVPGVFRYS